LDLICIFSLVYMNLIKLVSYGSRSYSLSLSRWSNNYLNNILSCDKERSFFVTFLTYLTIGSRNQSYSYDFTNIAYIKRGPIYFQVASLWRSYVWIMSLTRSFTWETKELPLNIVFVSILLIASSKSCFALGLTLSLIFNSSTISYTPY